VGVAAGAGTAKRSGLGKKPEFGQAILAIGLYKHPRVQYRNWTDMLVAASSERPLAHDRLEAIPGTRR
jgi:hypothetical protein